MVYVERFVDTCMQIGGRERGKKRERKGAKYEELKIIFSEIRAEERTTARIFFSFYLLKRTTELDIQ